MLFGWKPKSNASKVPVPLKYSSQMVEDIVEKLYDEENTELQQFPELVYQGFRPDNSFFVHEKFSSPETYTFRLSHLLASRHAYIQKNMSNSSENMPRPFFGMKKDVAEDCLVFNSTFEGGNLDTVIRKYTNEYDLFLRVDTNTRGHTSW